MNTINPPYLMSVGHDNSPSVLIAHMENGKILFMQQRLKNIMENYGINIPPSERKNFDNRSVVYLNGENDFLFEKAFRSIYYTLHMPKDEYQWLDKNPENI